MSDKASSSRVCPNTAVATSGGDGTDCSSRPMASKLARSSVVLVAGGSYNPPTFMHLRMFERARDHLEKTCHVKVLAGLISPVNDAFRKADLVHSRHRLHMLRLATASSMWIRTDDWECRQQSWTRTVQLLRDVRQRFSARTKCDKSEPTSSAGDKSLPVRVMLLCGGDMLESFKRPGLWMDEDIEEIVRDFGIVAISRTGSDPQKCIADIDSLYLHQNNIQIISDWVCPNDVSSTNARKALRRGESVKYLLDDAVIEYIRENRLYTAPKKDDDGTTQAEYSSAPTSAVSSTSPPPPPPKPSRPSTTTVKTSLVKAPKLCNSTTTDGAADADPTNNNPLPCRRRGRIQATSGNDDNCISAKSYAKHPATHEDSSSQEQYLVVECLTAIDADCYGGTEPIWSERTPTDDDAQHTAATTSRSRRHRQTPNSLPLSLCQQQQRHRSAATPTTAIHEEDDSEYDNMPSTSGAVPPRKIRYRSTSAARAHAVTKAAEKATSAVHNDRQHAVYLAKSADSLPNLHRATTLTSPLTNDANCGGLSPSNVNNVVLRFRGFRISPTPETTV